MLWTITRASAWFQITYGPISGLRVAHCRDELAERGRSSATMGLSSPARSAPGPARRTATVFHSCDGPRSNKCIACPGRGNSSLSNCAFLNPRPALCTTARLGVVSPPMNNKMPSMPSFPTTAFSADAPFSMTLRREHDERGGEITVVQLTAGFIKHLAERHLHGLQLRKKTRAHRLRQGGEQDVLFRSRGRHEDSCSVGSSLSRPPCMRIVPLLRSIKHSGPRRVPRPSNKASVVHVSLNIQITAYLGFGLCASPQRPLTGFAYCSVASLPTVNAVCSRRYSVIDRFRTREIYAATVESDV